jgi:hypothetical protein
MEFLCAHADFLRGKSAVENRMNAFLHSPFTIGVCLLLLLGWVMMLCAIFWPQKGSLHKDDFDARF